MRIWIFCVVVFAALGVGAAGRAASSTLPARMPGLWQSTTTVTAADGKPLPNATGIVTVSCVDPATDMKFFTSGDSACSSLSIEGTGSTYTINGTCTQGGKPVRVQETLVYASSKSVMLTAELDAPMGPMSVMSHLQWRGGCLAGMKPGDEGSIVNGAFSKADNINDPANQ